MSDLFGKIINFFATIPPIAYISGLKKYIVAGIVFIILLFLVILLIAFLGFLLIDVKIYKLPPEKLFKLTFKEFWGMIQQQRKINEVKYATELKFAYSRYNAGLTFLLALAAAWLCWWQKVAIFFVIPIIILIPFFNKYLFKKFKIDTFYYVGFLILFVMFFYALFHTYLEAIFSF